MEPPKLSWSDGVPIADRFDDPYYAKSDGLAETRHTFLAGNHLPERFCDGFHIAELGFGTGLNLAASWQAFLANKTPGKLHFTSFEAYPMPAQDRHRALETFPDIKEQAAWLDAGLEGGATQFETDTLIFTLITGDARQTLPKWDQAADAWFLDGFSPAKNPELWEAALMKSVGDHTAPQGTFATYTAAGHVRRKLEAAGFEVSRVPGFGTKRHMSIGRRAA